MPHEAIEADREYGELLYKIIDLRVYARAKEVYEQGQKIEDLQKRPRGPAIERVREIVFEIAKERIKAQQT